MRTRHSGRRASRAGFTILEASIGSLVLLLFAGTVVETLTSMRDGTLTTRVEDRLQLNSRRALESIVTDLSYSGLVTADGRDYPLHFDDGVLEGDYDPYEVIAHEPAAENSVEGRADFGPNREIVLLHPADNDDDGVPDVADVVTSQLVWDVDEPISYTLETNGNGENVLVRRRGNAPGRVIARGVERIRFLSSADTGFQIPLDAVRVELHFLLEDDDGHQYRHRTETTVRLRNGAST